MYRVSKQLWFCAAHQVRLSETQCEAMHGHNYRVLVHAEARELDRSSYVIDFAELREELKARRFTPVAVRETMIPKANGKTRRLGIPTEAA